MNLSSKHRATLAAIFSHPTPKSLEWDRVERLFGVLGAEIDERAGSGVSVALKCPDGTYAVESFHRPHPAKEAKPYQVRAARALLERAGIRP